MTDTEKDNNKVNIATFVKCLGEKNYAEADKYLNKAIEQKLLQRIKDNKKTNIFKS